MWKKTLISVIIVTLIVIGFEIILLNKSKQEKNVIGENSTQISNTYVTDECVNEWEDYALTKEEESKETSNNINNQNRHYLLKEENGYIYIYILNDETKEETLYKKTEISTEYLTENDVKEIQKGIHIFGDENLNKLLEDFE